MTSFYESRNIGDHSGMFPNPNHESSNYLLNIYSSRGKLLDVNTSHGAKSPNRELDKALDQMFKGFSFYSEPTEEREV
jgi:hypothetical protein